MTRIFYFCSHTDAPVGGNKVIYHHVDILNAHGVEAYVVHLKRGFRCSWFKNNTKIAYPIWNWSETISQFFEIVKGKTRKLRWDDQSHLMKVCQIETWDSAGNKQILSPINENDILVFPEFIGKDLFEVYRGLPFVVFVQRAYISLRHCGLSKNKQSLIRDKNDNPHFYDSQLKEVIVVSEDNKQYLSTVFPKIEIDRIHLSVDKSKFYYPGSKKKQIAFMPRRHKEDAQQIVTILKEMNVFTDWNIYPIDGISEVKVAEILRESAIFMSFSEMEGFGLPPLEAMASGCITIGYHGQGGKEFLTPPYAYPIENGDIIGFVKTIVKEMQRYETNREEFLNNGKKSSDFVHERFTHEREEQDVIRIWKKILNE